MADLLRAGCKSRLKLLTKTRGGNCAWISHPGNGESESSLQVTYLSPISELVDHYRTWYGKVNHEDYRVYTQGDALVSN